MLKIGTVGQMESGPRTTPMLRLLSLTISRFIGHARHRVAQLLEAQMQIVLRMVVLALAFALELSNASIQIEALRRAANSLPDQRHRTKGSARNSSNIHASVDLISFMSPAKGRFALKSLSGREVLGSATLVIIVIKDPHMSYILHQKIEWSSGI